MGLLRLLLALSVLLAHAGDVMGYYLVDSETAVQSFYIISGFYMSLILNEKYIRENSSYRLFISNRLLRLYPIYWTVLLLTVLFSVTMYVRAEGNYLGTLHTFIEYFDTMSIGSFALLVFSNIFIFFQDLLMFFKLDTSSGNLLFTEKPMQAYPPLHKLLFVPQAWTIGMELMFYLIAPFLVRRGLKIIVPLMVASMVLKLFLYQKGLQYDPWTYRFFPAELVYFLLGNISYLLYKKIRQRRIDPLLPGLVLLFILGFTLCFDIFSFPNNGVVYLLCVFIAVPFLFRNHSEHKFDRYLGELSYPIYISHMFVLMLIESPKIPKIGGLSITAAIITILLSIVLNEFVAKKVERVRQSRVKTTPDTPPADTLQPIAGKAKATV